MAKVVKKGKDYYIDYIDAAGKRWIRKVGPSYEQAKYILDKKLSERTEMRHLGDVRTYTPMTLGTMIPRYLQNTNAKKRPQTYRLEKLCFRHLLRIIGNKYLDTISIRAVDEYICERIKSVEPGTVNRELACLQALLNKAVEWKILKVNPLGKLKKLKEPPGRVRYLALDELGRLLKKLALHILPVVICALYTGMRKGEILALTWRDVDLKNNFIHIGQSKTHERRDIPIAEELKAEFLKLDRKTARVFEGVGDFKKAWLGALARASIEDFRFHDLRHTFASYLVMAGESLIVVKELLGHKTLDMTLRYAHLAPDAKKAAIKRLSQSYKQEPHE